MTRIISDFFYPRVVGAKRAEIILQKPTINRLSLGALFEMRTAQEQESCDHTIFGIFYQFYGRVGYAKYMFSGTLGVLLS